MNYVENVTTVFLARCPRVAVLSPEDYTLIAEWEKEQIPFEIVAASIIAVCERTNAHADIKSVRYFDSTIQNNFTAWLQTAYRAANHPRDLT